MYGRLDTCLARGARRCRRGARRAGRARARPRGSRPSRPARPLSSAARPPRAIGSSAPARRARPRAFGGVARDVARVVRLVARVVDRAAQARERQARDERLAAARPGRRVGLCGRLLLALEHLDAVAHLVDHRGDLDVVHVLVEVEAACEVEQLVRLVVLARVDLGLGARLRHRPHRHAAARATARLVLRLVVRALRLGLRLRLGRAHERAHLRLARHEPLRALLLALDIVQVPRRAPPSCSAGP